MTSYLFFYKMYVVANHNYFGQSHHLFILLSQSGPL